MDEQQKPIVLQKWQLDFIADMKWRSCKSGSSSYLFITRKNGKSKSSADVIDEVIRQGREA